MRSTASTPPVRSRRQQAEERREQIVDAALQVFSEKGFAGASIRDIARLVGVTEGLIYHYFESKEELLNACRKERAWRAHLERILAQAEGKPVGEVLRELADDLLKTLQEQGPVVRMWAFEMQRHEEIAKAQLAMMEENRSLMADFLSERRKSGELRADADVESAVGVLMGGATSLFFLYGRIESEVWTVVADNFVRGSVDVILRGIAPYPQ